MAVGYRLFKRQSGKRKVYYIRILDQGGNVSKTVSTGKTSFMTRYLTKEKEIEICGSRNDTMGDFINVKTLITKSLGLFWTLITHEFGSSCLERSP